MKKEIDKTDSDDFKCFISVCNIHLYVHEDIVTYIYECTCIYIYIHDVYIHIYIHSTYLHYICIYIYISIHDIYIYICIYIDIYMHDMYIYIHIYTLYMYTYMIIHA